MDSTEKSPDIEMDQGANNEGGEDKGLDLASQEGGARLESLDKLFRSVSKRFFHIVQAELKKRGLPPQTMAVMRQIFRSPGMSVSDLARATGNVKSHVSYVVESLQEAGFLEKTKDPSDQRLVRIRPTEKAMKEFQELRKSLKNRLSHAMEALSDEKVEAIIDGLRSLEKALREEETREKAGKRC